MTREMSSKKRLAAGLMAASLLITGLPDKALADQPVVLQSIMSEAGKNPVYIEVKNNVAIPDTVTFKGVIAQDTVKVYPNIASSYIENGVEQTKNEAGTEPIGQATAKSRGDLTVSLKKPNDQIIGDFIWVSLTNYGKHESVKVQVEVPAAPKTEISHIQDFSNEDPSKPIDKTEDYFELKNYVGIADQLEVKNPSLENPKLPALVEKTQVKIYKQVMVEGEESYLEIGQGVVKKDGKLTINLKEQLPEIKHGEGNPPSVYISLTEYNTLESDRIALEIPKEAGKTESLLKVENIISTNNVVIADTLEIKGKDGDITVLEVQDIIKVYKAKKNDSGDWVKSETLLSSTSIKKTGEDLLIKLKDQLSHGEAVYISLTKYGKGESAPVLVEMPAAQSTKIDYIKGSEDNREKKYFQINNYVGIPDQLEVLNPALEEGSELPAIPEKTQIKVFGSNPTAVTTGISVLILGQGVVKKDGKLTINLKEQLPEIKDKNNPPSVYISLTEYNKLESQPLELKIPEEASSSSNLADDDVSLTNNVSIADTLEIKGKNTNGENILEAKDTIKVYKAEKDDDGNWKDFDKTTTVLLTSVSVKKTGENLVISLKEQFTKDDKIFVSLTKYGNPEGEALGVVFEKAEEVSERLKQNQVNIENNVGIPDIVTVTGLTDKSLVKIYDRNSSNEKAQLLGSGTAKKDGKVTISLKEQLPEVKGGDNPPKIHISQTEYNKLEGPSLAIEVESEKEDTEKLTSKNIEVTNNVVIPDTLLVKNLKAKDMIKVYRDRKKEELLATATAKKDGDSVLIKLKEDFKEGDRLFLFLTITGYGRPESDVTEVTFKSEEKSIGLKEFQVSIQNNVGIPDTISLIGLPEKSEVKVYALDPKEIVGTQVLASGKAKKDGSLFISLKEQLPEIVDPNNPPKIYLTLTEYNKLESFHQDQAGVLALQVPDQDGAEGLEKKEVIIINNVSIQDTVEVRDLMAKDKIEVFNNKLARVNNSSKDEEVAGDLLASGTAKKDGDSVLIKLKEQLNEGDKIWISRIAYGRPASSPKQYEIGAAEVSSQDKLNSLTIFTNNNVGIADTVEIIGLEAKESIQIYKHDGRLLGEGQGKKGKDVLVSLKQPFDKEDEVKGIFVALTEDNKLPTETRRKIEVGSEGSSNPIEKGVYITNNVSIADTIEVNSLKAKDLVKVFANRKEGSQNMPGQELEAVTVKKDGNLLIKLKKQIEGDLIWISLTEYGKEESVRKDFKVPAPDGSKIISEGNIVIYNNHKVADTVEVSGLEAKDIITVYARVKVGEDKMARGKELGRATAKKDGMAIVTIKELPEEIEITRTEYNKLPVNLGSYKVEDETKTQIGFGVVTIFNNVGTAPQVQVEGGLFPKDTINVYQNLDGKKGALLGTGTAKKLDETLVITLNKNKKIVEKVFEEDDKVLVTLTSYGKTEGDLVPQKIPGKNSSAILDKKLITVRNYAKPVADEVEILGLDEKDTVTIYDSRGLTLGQGTAKKGGSLLIKLKNQLTEPDIWLTLRSDNALESDKLKVEVPLEQTTQLPSNLKKSSTPKANQFELSNDGSKLRIELNNTLGLVEMKIYEDDVLGVLDLTEDNKSIEISLNQISGKYVWISLTEEGRSESNKLRRPVPKQETSKKLLSRNVDALSDGEFHVRGLDSGDTITAYNQAGDVLDTATSSSGGRAVSVFASKARTSERYAWLTVKERGKAESSKLKIRIK